MGLDISGSHAALCLYTRRQQCSCSTCRTSCCSRWPACCRERTGAWRRAAYGGCQTPIDSVDDAMRCRWRFRATCTRVRGATNGLWDGCTISVTNYCKPKTIEFLTELVQRRGAWLELVGGEACRRRRRCCRRRISSTGAVIGPSPLLLPSPYKLFYSMQRMMLIWSCTSVSWQATKGNTCLVRPQPCVPSQRRAGRGALRAFSVEG